MEFDRICLNCFSQRGAYDVCPYCGYMAGTPPQEPYLLAPGTRLWGRYIMGTVLGIGGFGVTYKAWDTRLGAMVAIKEFFPQGLASRIPGEAKLRVFSGEKTEHFRAQLARFINEAKNLARFAGERHIVSVLDYFEDNATAYIVMEYLDGMTLKDYLAQNGGRLAQDTALVIEAGILQGLACIHQKGIIHRDISPDNVYILRSGEVKLLDFGAARFAAAEGSDLTQSVVVKKGYAPPEQYRTNMKQGVWTDIYAAGATLYKMLTGATPEESIERYENDRLAKVSQTGTQVDAAVDSAVMRAMALKPEIRFKSADAMLAVLENRTVVAEPEQEIKKRKRRGAAAVAASVVALVVAVALVASSLGGGGGLARVVIGGGPSLADVNISPDTITVMTLLSSESTNSAAELQRLQQLADAFTQQYPQHTVTIEPVYYNYNNPQEDYDALRAQLAPRMATAEAPAVFDMSFYDYFEEDADYQAELTPLYNALEMDDYLLLGDWWKQRQGRDDPTAHSAYISYSFYIAYGNPAAAEVYGIAMPESFSSFEEILQLEREYPGAVRLYPHNALDAINAMHPSLGQEDPARVADMLAQYAEMYKGGYFGEYVYDNATGQRLPEEYACDMPVFNISSMSRVEMEYQNQDAGGAAQCIPLLADGKILCNLYPSWYVSSYVTENQQNLGMLFLHFMFSERGQELLYLQSEHDLPINRASMETFARVHGLSEVFTPAFTDQLTYDNNGINAPYEVGNLIQDQGAGYDEVYEAVMAYWDERNSS